MTRINTMYTFLLTNNQLLAEYRELPRVINKVSKAKFYKNIPLDYRMGTGHESFFGDKLLYLHKRHQQILDELAHRKSLYPEIFKSDYIIDTTAAFKQASVLFPDLCKDWEPSIDDVCTNLDRLIERQYLQTKGDKFGSVVIPKSDIWDKWAKHVDTFYRSQQVTNRINISMKTWRRKALYQGVTI